MPALTTVDVCVVGGGPAGSVAARLLASWGWAVALLHRQPTLPPLAESLPSSTRKILALVGVADAVTAAAFFPNTGNTALWAGNERRTVSPPGYHVSRAAWDALLLASAASAGAQVVEATVRHLDVASRRIVALRKDGTPLTCRANYILDCSGRAGVVARHGFRRRRAGYRTLAVAAEWHTPRWPEDERTRTVVESGTAGWSWSVPLSRDTRQCTVMIDLERVAPGTSKGRATASLQEVYDRELSCSSAMRARLNGAHQIGAAWACDASVYDCSRAADGHVLLVGDAASFVEPLSSAGVKKAMLSGWRAAVVANTCLRDADRRAIALEYHDRRERQIFRTCTREAASFFGQAAAAHGGEFWAARHAFSGGPADDDALDDADPHALERGEVAAAFERLRTSASARLRVSPSLERGPATTIEDREIVVREGLRLPGFATPVRFASNINLPALVGIVSRHDDPGSALRAYCTEVSDVAPADVLRGLSLLVARRAILEEGVRP